MFTDQTNINTMTSRLAIEAKKEAEELAKIWRAEVSAYFKPVIIKEVELNGSQGKKLVAHLFVLEIYQWENEQMFNEMPTVPAFHTFNLTQEWKDMVIHALTAVLFRSGEHAPDWSKYLEYYTEEGYERPRY